MSDRTAERAYPATVPVLTDGVVTLRALVAADLPLVVEIANDPQVIPMTTIPQPYGPDQARDFLAMVRGWWTDPGELPNRLWAIEVEAGDGSSARVFAGTLHYGYTGPTTADVGYVLHPARRGHGYAARALRLIIEDAFSTGVEVLHWKAAVGNWVSRRIAWSCGFRHEGRVRSFLEMRPGEPPQDVWLATLSRTDPREPVTPWPGTSHPV